MPLQPIDALLLRRCGKADTRALLGNGGGHQVVVFGQRETWTEVFGINVTSEKLGGIDLPIRAELGGAGGYTLHAYYTTGYRHEVRVAVGPMLAAKAQVARGATAVKKLIDPDQKTATEEWIACIVRTKDGSYHTRGMLVSSLPESLRKIDFGMAYGRKVVQGALLDPDEAKVWRALMEHRAVLLFGPPGTGKTRLMLRIRNAFEKGIPDIGFDPSDTAKPLKETNTSAKLPSKRRVGFATFHQGLTYENFVVGLRPTTIGGKMLIEAKDGLFLELAGHALGDDAAALLLIDELNRGNAADIFGELITVLELDKRLGIKNIATDNTVTVRLPTPPENRDKVARLKQDFQMPFHFYLLASMNSLDRAVAPLDSAMRRRFRVIPLAPKSDVAAESLLGEAQPVENVAALAAPTRIEVGTIALRAWQHLNSAISRHWGPEFLLGHSYVLGIQDPSTLVSAFSEAILPQLWELYRDRPTDLAEALRLDIAGDSEALAVKSDDESVIQLGLSQGTPIRPLDLSAMALEDAIRRLSFLAFGRSWASPAGSAQASQAAKKQ